MAGTLLFAWTQAAAPALAQPVWPTVPTDPAAAGKRLVLWKCNSCHLSRRAFESVKTEAEWRVTVARMVENGLYAKPEELEAIVKYLASLNTPEATP